MWKGLTPVTGKMPVPQVSPLKGQHYIWNIRGMQGLDLIATGEFIWGDFCANGHPPFPRNQASSDKKGDFIKSKI
jgi:hypothetical protein